MTMRGFRAAQTAYENMEDPNSQDVPMTDCSECDGTGVGLDDFDNEVPGGCDQCNGSGEVEIDPNDCYDDSERDDDDDICPEGYDGT